jgi:hypothetical protein
MLPTNFSSFGQAVSDEKIFSPCLLTNQDNMINHNRGPSIDVSYQVSVHLTKRFQRKRFKCEKLPDDSRRTLSNGKSSHRLSVR